MKPAAQTDSFANHERDMEPQSDFVRLSHLRKLQQSRQAAAVCYRIGGETVEFLLIQARGSKRWTFPKGNAEPGLTHAQAAALEAFEEAGVHGRIESVAFIRYSARKRLAENRAMVNAHLCQVQRLVPPKESNRNRTWFTAADAKRRLGEGRDKKDAAQLTQVIDRAVFRIQQLIDGNRLGAHRAWQPREGATVIDPIRQVQFEAQGYRVQPVFPSYEQLERPAEMRNLSSRDRELLKGEILQFSTARPKAPVAWRNAKALGPGLKNT